MVRAETVAALMAALDQLSADQRDCVTLRFLQGRSIAETAKAMNRGEGAVKALTYRAVRHLTVLLQAS